MTFLNSVHKKLTVRYIRFIQVNIKVQVCLLSCSFKSTCTLIFTFAFTDTYVLATVFKKSLQISKKKYTFQRCSLLLLEPYRIFSNKHRFSNKRHSLISAAPLGTHIEISDSL